MFRGHWFWPGHACFGPRTGVDRACFSAAERRATSEANWGAKARNSLKNYCKKEEAASKGEVLLRRGGLNYLYTPAPGLGPHSLTESRASH